MKYEKLIFDRGEFRFLFLSPGGATFSRFFTKKFLKFFSSSYRAQTFWVDTGHKGGWQDGRDLADNHYLWHGARFSAKKMSVGQKRAVRWAAPKWKFLDKNYFFQLGRIFSSAQ